jgi:hypothetical protein
MSSRKALESVNRFGPKNREEMQAPARIWSVSVA